MKPGEPSMPTAATSTTKLLSRAEAAKFLGLAEQTLAVWASEKRYPLPFMRIGRRVLYKLSDLEKFIERGREDLGADDE